MAGFKSTADSRDMTRRDFTLTTVAPEFDQVLSTRCGHWRHADLAVRYVLKKHARAPKLRKTTDHKET